MGGTVTEPVAWKRSVRHGLLVLLGLAVWLFAQALAPAGASAHHSSFTPLPNGGRLPGQPDFKKVGKTTYRFLPGKEEYEVKKEGQPPAFAHVDPEPYSSGTAKASGPGVPLPSSELAPICRSTGHRIIPVYIRRPGDFSAVPVEQIRSIVRRMNWKIAQQSSLSSSGAREVKMVVDCTGGSINVRDLTTANNTLTIVRTALTKTYGDPFGVNAVKYLVFDKELEAEHSEIAGIGEWRNDPDKEFDNQSVTFTETAILYEDTWEVHTSIHELMHTLGASQGPSKSPPPFSSKKAHCIDGLDILCYKDEPNSQYSESYCPASSGYNQPNNVPIDCGKDTYFNAAPAPGTWLAEHWNVASWENQYLIAPGAPRLFSPEISSIHQHGATFEGIVYPEGLNTSYQIEYGATTGYGSTAPVSPEDIGEVDTEVSQQLAGLAEGTTYHVRLKATNSAGTVTGSDIQFTTKQPVKVATKAATNVSRHSVTLNGTVNPNYHAGKAWFQYGTDTKYFGFTEPEEIGLGGNDVSVSKTISNLKANTTYHYRAVGSSSEGTVVGEDMTFTTGPEPTVSTGLPTVAKGGDVTLTGTINPHGLLTAYVFEYGQTMDLGYGVPFQAPSVGSGTSDVPISEVLAGLTKGKRYFYRLTAIFSEGLVHGDMRSFGVPDGPPMVSTGVVTENQSSYMHGTVDSRGGASSFYFEYGPTTSYGSKTTPDKIEGGQQKVKAAGEFTVGSTYHYRIVATNPEGTEYGADRLHLAGRSAGVFLNSFGSNGSGVGEFDEQTDVEIDMEGNVLVADTGNDRIEKFDSAGSYLGQFGDGGLLAEPRGIGVDSDGYVFVADTGNDRVQVFSPGGTHLAEIGSESGLNEPTDVAVDASGCIYVSDTGNDRIEKLDPNGKDLLELAGKGDGPGEVEAPRGIAVYGGKIWIADSGNQRVQALSLSGQFTWEASSASGDGQLAEPVDVAFNSSQLYVVDGGDDRVVDFEFYSGYRGQFSETEFGVELTGIATSSDGKAYLANGGGSRIERWHLTAPPTVVTNGTGYVQAEKASVLGEVTPNSSPNGLAATYWFQYGTTTSYGNSAPTSPSAVSPGIGPVFAGAELTGLSKSTTYHYRLVASNERGTSYGEDRTFTTAGDPLPPTVGSLSATGVKHTEATLHTSVNPNGLSSKYQFEYGTTTSYGAKVPASPSTFGSGNSYTTIDYPITGLSKSTTYHYRLVISNSAGTTTTSDRTFTTAEPVVSTGAATGVKATEATLAGKVNPSGLATSYQIEYGPSTSYGTKVPVPAGSVGSGSGDVEVSKSISGLAENTTYHYRVVATNEAATGAGEDRTFTTLPRGASLEDVSCSSPVSCFAVGSYFDAAGRERTRIVRWHELVEYNEELNGMYWTDAGALEPSGATAARLTSVSCLPTSCHAVGYATLSDGRQMAIAGQSDGADGSWSLQTLPAKGQWSRLDGISCTATSCTAVGSYSAFANGEKSQAWVLKLAGLELEGNQVEIWRTQAGFQSYIDLPSFRLTSVSCVSDSCYAVGSVTQNNGAEMAIAGSNDGSGWIAHGVEGKGSWSRFEDVSCASAATCTAVGSYSTSTTGTAPKGLVANLAEEEIEESEVTYWKNNAALTSDATSGVDGSFRLTGVSCFADRCQAVGSTSASNAYPVVAYMSGWTPPWIDNEGNKWMWGRASDISCTTVADCTAVGSYSTTTKGENAHFFALSPTEEEYEEQMLSIWRAPLSGVVF